MSEQEIKVPDLGGADEVEIIEITVSAGDSVEEEDPILTVESDKASVELPSPGKGKITKITVKVGDTVKEGDVVGILDVSGDDDAGGAGEQDDSGDGDAQAEAGDSDSASAAATPADESGSSKAQSNKPKKSGGSRKETVKVPPLDGFDNVPVIEINVSEGDTIEVDDPLVTVESDKATMEIPSPYAGKVGKILVSENDKISEGHELLEMTVEDDGADEGTESEPASSEASSAPAKDDKAREAEQAGGTGKKTTDAPEELKERAESTDIPSSGAKVHAGPAVRKLAREFGADLSVIKGSGPKNRILKEDVQVYVKNQLQRAQQSGSAAPAGSGIPGVKLPDFSQFGDIKREPMSRMMSATAANMQRNWLNVPHVTQFEDADITEMESFRKSQKAAGEKKGIKMTPLPFLLKACAQALAELPQFNVSLDMDKKEIVRKHYIHIGIAVDTPAGLMVPVIRDVDTKGLWELAAESAELAQKARDKQLKPAEMQGACFTITSLGGIGGTAFTPIVNAPEVAILGVSKASMKPVWDGAEFQPRLMLPLSLSYDHRAVNGADAARFTSVLAELLGDIRRLLL